MVWHFTTPKCASTYFQKYIDHIIHKNKQTDKVGIIRAVPEFGERPQSICKYHLNEHIKFRKKFSFITYRQHTQATDDLLKIVNKKTHDINKYRSISILWPVLSTIGMKFQVVFGLQLLQIIGKI